MRAGKGSNYRRCCHLTSLSKPPITRPSTFVDNTGILNGRRTPAKPYRPADRATDGAVAARQAQHGLLNHTYQFLGVDTYKQTSTEPIPTGDVTVKMLFEADEPKPGSGSKVTLWANGKQIGEGTMPQTVSLLFTT